MNRKVFLGLFLFIVIRIRVPACYKDGTKAVMTYGKDK